MAVGRVTLGLLSLFGGRRRARARTNSRNEAPLPPSGRATSMRRHLPAALVAIGIFCGLGLYTVHYLRTAPARYVASISDQKRRLVAELDSRNLRSDGAMALKEFFGHWRHRQFDRMESMLADPSHWHRRRWDFKQAMAESEVNWIQAEILADEPATRGRMVRFRIQITSPESLYAAAGESLTAAIRGRRNRDGSTFVAPLLLGIETYASYELDWLVETVEGRPKIDTFPAEKEDQIDLLGYFALLDAPRRPHKNGRSYWSDYSYGLLALHESIRGVLRLTQDDYTVVEKSKSLAPRASANLKLLDQACKAGLCSDEIWP